MLAIVIPYYKINFFEETLESLVCQTDKRFKVYIGDDASPEDPSYLIAKYKYKFEFKYNKFNTNLGSSSLVKQWHRCIDMIQDERWIMILGDDDFLSENVVEEFYKNEEFYNNTNVIRFASCKINEKTERISDVYKNPKIELATDFLFRKTRSSLSEHIFKKNKVDEIRFKNFPLAWFSDVLAIMEFADFKNIFSINEAIVYVRISNISISGSKNNEVLKAKATFEFYFYLLSKKASYFSEIQIIELLNKFKRVYFNNKKSISDLFKISYLYLSNYWISKYIIFLKELVLVFFRTKDNASRIKPI